MTKVTSLPIITHITTVPYSLFFFRGQPAFMMRRGMSFQLISSPGPMLDKFARLNEISVHEVNMARQITPFRDLLSIGSLIRTLRTVRPDIVHAHTPKGGLLGMIGAWAARVPVRIYHIRGLPYMTARGRRRLMLEWAERVSCKLASQVLCVSDSIMSVAIEDGICPTRKIKVLLGGSGNGVDAQVQFNPERFSFPQRISLKERYGIEPSSPVIGYIGRIVKDKGVEELAEAWSALESVYPDAHLLIVGPLEPQDPVAEESLDVLRSSDRVHFEAYADDPASFYSILDVLALPSYREGFGNVLIEAASLEIPTVATSIPGCIDAVEDGVTGLLVKPHDAEALRAALAKYLDDAELRVSHGKAGRRRVLRNFQQEDIWEAIYQEYCRLLTEKGIAIPQYAQA